MNIYLIRHGLTEWNKLKMMQGWENSNLSEQGIEQGKQLGEWMAKKELEYVFCSPSGRTIETLELLQANKAVSYELLPDLREIKLGPWEGMPIDQVIAEYSDQYHNFWNDPIKFELVDSETFQQVKNRCETALAYIIQVSELKKHECIGIISHAAYIKCLLNLIQAKSIKDLWEEPFIHPTSVTKLTYHSDTRLFSIAYMGKIDHYNIKV